MCAKGFFELIFKIDWYCSRALSLSLPAKYIFASALCGPINCGLASIAFVKNSFAFLRFFCSRKSCA